MRRTVTKIGLIILLAVGTVGLTGCDSGGGSGGGGEPSSIEKTDGVTVNLKQAETSSSSEKAKVTGDLTVDFHYENSSKEDCTLSKTESGVSPGYSGGFDPSNIQGGCENVAEFDGVRAYYKAGSDTSPMTLEILTADGSETIASLTSDNAANGIEVAETVSDDVNLPDEIGGGVGGGDDGSGDEGTGGDDTIDSASELASRIQGTWRLKSFDEIDGVNWIRFNKVDTDLDLWGQFAIGAGCGLNTATFTIIDGSTIEYGSFSDNPEKASVSYANGTLKIEGPALDQSLTLERGEKDPFQDRCDFSDELDSDMGY